MSKSISDDVLDAALSLIANNGDKLCICSQQPTTYAQAITTYNIGTKSLAVGVGNGVYSITDGAGGGRMLTVAQQTAVSIANSGTSAYVALCDSANQRLLFADLMAPNSLTAGNTATVDGFTYTINDPS